MQPLRRLTSPNGRHELVADGHTLRLISDDEEVWSEDLDGTPYMHGGGLAVRDDDGALSYPHPGMLVLRDDGVLCTYGSPIMAAGFLGAQVRIYDEPTWAAEVPPGVSITVDGSVMSDGQLADAVYRGLAEGNPDSDSPAECGEDRPEG